MINGGAGDDVIHGGTGTDVMMGGGGNDLFTFTAGDSPRLGWCVLGRLGWRAIGAAAGIDQIRDWISADRGCSFFSDAARPISALATR